MKLLLFLFFTFPFFSTADCGVAYSFNEKLEYIGQVKRQKSPLEFEKCLIPARSTLEMPPSHKWKVKKWDSAKGKWELVDPDIGENPDPEIYVRIVDADSGPKWEIDPGLVAVKEAKEKAEAAAEKAEREKALEDWEAEKVRWAAACLGAKAGSVESLICQERGFPIE